MAYHPHRPAINIVAMASILIGVIVVISVPGLVWKITGVILAIFGLILANV